MSAAKESSWATATDSTPVDTIRNALSAPDNNTATATASSPSPSPSPSPSDKDVDAVTDAVDATTVDDSERSVGLNQNDSTAKVEIIGITADSVYKSATSFAELGLSKELLQGITDQKFVNPSKIQAEALPIILMPRHPNLIGQAHAGSGKTAAFSLGILSQIDIKNPAPQALVVVPTRELANQNVEVIQNLAKYTQIKITALVKSSAKDDRRSRVEGQVIVGTPGSIIQKLDTRLLDTKYIRIFVADEADEMIDEQGLGEQTLRIKKKLPHNCQILLFSATFDEDIKNFARQIAPQAVELLVKTELLALPAVKQFSLECRDYDDKYNNLKGIYAVLDSIGQSIIFVQTVAMAKKLTNQMRRDGNAVSLLHGKDMTAEERDRVVDDFKKGLTSFLIATNVIARGLDVPAVKLVVNFEVPLTRKLKPDFESYIHRINRAGRFGRKGAAITMVDSPQTKQVLNQIEAFYRHQCVPLPSGDVDKITDAIAQHLG